MRTRSGAANVLRDKNDLPTERLLQAVWRHQRLRRDQLKTADGKTVRIFHPGFASTEGGPDFCGAVVQIGDDPPRSGDVEIDLRADGWRAHRHNCNPNFKNVLLHVVWEEAQPMAEAPPMLSLSHALDAPLNELELWLESEAPRSFPESLRGKCCAPLSELDETQLVRLLREAAGVRFQFKAAQFRARAQQAGWEQSFWEGLFRALGYKHNAWPMQNLAELRRRWIREVDSPFDLQARLFGVSGLLPSELPRERASGDGYLRRVWDFWWRERGEFQDCILPRAAWKFHGLRPANYPQRRLALAAHWLAAGNLIQRLESWCAADLPDGRLSDSLLEVFEVKRDEFWSWHWTFRSARLQKPQPLLGSARLTDLAVNVILPWLWTRAVEGKNNKFQRIIERRYFVWPLGQDNSVLRLARQRLLGARRGCSWRGAAVQQGLMQIVRDFCGNSNAVCENCRFPELVRTWRAQAVT
ncbi:MAG TPA: DUF2851 family protein [Candidatus Saccharimonadales bacterium]|nr:DUF2851 family protein [Candidatus Saccharimonadales bacterium]